MREAVTEIVKECNKVYNNHPNINVKLKAMKVIEAAFELEKIMYWHERKEKEKNEQT